jgi:hypothetical protein
MTEEEKERYAAGFAVHVGVDTGKSFHELVARRPGDVRSKPCKVTVEREGFDAAHAYLQELFPGVAPTPRLSPHPAATRPTQRPQSLHPPRAAACTKAGGRRGRTDRCR